MLGYLEVAMQQLTDGRTAVQRPHAEWVSGDASSTGTYRQPQVPGQEAHTKPIAVILRMPCISG